jgi:hypothetical protein
VWNRFIICLVAPQTYLSRWADEAGLYDTTLTYESVVGWLSENLTPSQPERA